MRIAVVGASGTTGRCVVEQALDRGHRVVAMARHVQTLPLRHEHLGIRNVDVLDASGLSHAIAGVDAVVSTLGIGSSREETTVYSHGVRNILAAMSGHGIRALSVTSAAPAGPRREQSPFDRGLLMPVMDRFFGATYRDMRRMENELQRSGVDWVVLRPPRLLAKPAIGHYRVGREPVKGARSLTFADLATALLDSLSKDELHRNAWYVVN